MANGRSKEIKIDTSQDELVRQLLLELLARQGGQPNLFPGASIGPFGAGAGPFSREPAGFAAPPGAFSLSAPGGTGRVHFMGGSPFKPPAAPQIINNALLLASRIAEALGKRGGGGVGGGTVNTGAIEDILSTIPGTGGGVLRRGR